MNSPDLTFRIQHRETGCWLSADRDRDAWVSFKDIRWATTFKSADDAKHACRLFGLTPDRFRITSSTAMPTQQN
jgi:hypothetical protein